MAIERSFPRKVSAKDVDAKANHVGIGAVRQVRHKITVGGLEIPTIKSWTKSESAHSAGSSASVVLPRILPDFPDLDLFELARKHLPLQLAIKTSIRINGRPVYSTEFVEEFCGVIDTLDANYEAGTMTLQARSYAQILLNEKVNDVIASPASAKKKTTDVVKEFTQRYGRGLKAHIDPKLEGMSVGQIYKEQMVKVVTNISVWDLFESFALKDNADLYVKGDTLYYTRKSTDTGPDITQITGVTPNYTFQWGYNIKGLNIKASPMFSHDVKVTVKSYQTRTGQTYTATKGMTDAQIQNLAKLLETSPETLKPKMERSVQKLSKQRKSQAKTTDVSSGAVSNSRVGNKQNYVFTIPNASQEDCDRVAAQIMKDISAKEFIVTLTVLGQPDFNPRQYIKLLNTGKLTDQVYAIKSIQSGFNMPDSGYETEGYCTIFTLVNHAVQTSGTSFGV